MPILLLRKQKGGSSRHRNRTAVSQSILASVMQINVRKIQALLQIVLCKNLRQEIGYSVSRTRFCCTTVDVDILFDIMSVIRSIFILTFTVVEFKVSIAGLAVSIVFIESLAENVCLMAFVAGQIVPLEAFNAVLTRRVVVHTVFNSLTHMYRRQFARIVTFHLISFVTGFALVGLEVKVFTEQINFFTDRRSIEVVSFNALSALRSVRISLAASCSFGRTALACKLGQTIARVACRAESIELIEGIAVITNLDTLHHDVVISSFYTFSAYS